ncbi:pyruvate ferredoxin oxidoreductase subunit gamma [Candidatus Micrarchaeota archaeon]|nr:pyruvate ferredoxin oxidoreductase subunit gamma [Candidatus Micrarchaeota archaeon]
MIEVRFHGRGGQGAVTAAEILAVAVGNKKYSQSFPVFGVERRGAPVQAFCRIDNKPIRVHQAVESPDYVCILDSSLLDYVDVCSGLKDDGILIINTNKSKDDIAKKLSRKNVKIYFVDATSIAFKYLGKGIVNTAMLGAFAKVADWVDKEDVELAIRERFIGKIADDNIKAMNECYDSLK